MTKKEKLAAWFRSIKRSNARFQKMSAPEKRVQVAKDVLAQLALRRINARNGTYLSIPSVAIQTRLYERVDEDLQGVFAKMTSCDACAIGAAFVCAVDRLDEVKNDALQSGSDREAMTEYLREQGLFSHRMLDLMEDAFEGIFGFNEGVEGRCATLDSNERLRRVMRRIVDCEGRIDERTFPAATYKDGEAVPFPVR